MKEELDLEEKTDVEPVGVPTEEAAGSPGAEEAVSGGDMSDEDGVMPGDEEKAESGELSPIKAFTESEGVDQRPNVSLRSTRWNGSAHGISPPSIPSSTFQSQSSPALRNNGS